MIRVFMLACVFTIGFGLQIHAQHIHDSHPTTSHGSGSAGGGWYRISLTEGPTTPTVAPGPSTWEVLVNHTETNNDCEPSQLGVDTTRSVTHTCTVGGKITVGGSVEAAAGALFAKCKATASASVEVNGSYSNSSTESVTIKSSKTFQPCDIKNYTFKKKKKTASGSITTWDHKIVCRKNSTGATYANYCNKTTLTGSATGWGETDGTWTNMGKVDPCPCDEDNPDDTEIK